MNRRHWLCTTGAAALTTLGWPFPRGWAVQAKARKTHVLFFTKSAGFEHSVIKRENDSLGHAERVLTDLGKKHDFTVTATKDGRVFDSDLERYDALFFFTTGDLTTAGTDGNPPISAKGKQALLDAIHGGKGFLGSHCASDTFHSSGQRSVNQPLEQRDPYIQMIGGEFVTHGEQQEAGLNLADAHFPGTDSLPSGLRITDEWYALKNFAEDMHVVLVQETNGMKGDMYHRPPFPETWARRHGDGRVFYTSLGHREDVWTNPSFQQILLGGLAWSAGNAKAEIRPNFKEVTPHADQLPK